MGGQCRPGDGSGCVGACRSWSGPVVAAAGGELTRNRRRASRAFNCSRAGGWSKGPSHSTYNALLTSKPELPIIGLTGLLNLLTVVTQLQATQQDCARAPQEAGVPCLAFPPTQSSWPALPPARGDTAAQSLGALAAGQSATTLAPARSSRRTAVKLQPAATSQPRGGQV
jgi:hypothetical protein